MSKTEGYFSDTLNVTDIDLSGICWKTLVNEHENATEIFLGEKPPQPPIFDGELMFFCDINCINCKCNHCGGRL